MYVYLARTTVLKLIKQWVVKFMELGLHNGFSDLASHWCPMLGGNGFHVAVTVYMFCAAFGISVDCKKHYGYLLFFNSLNDTCPSLHIKM